ncbi:MAG TPA: putative LPS assembly protein LptD, partial [Anseongella sp.]|nr:putative LPS assembly protein LptD [Anseongella sp.]
MVQSGQEITADSLKYNFDTRRAFAWNSLTAEGEGFIRGGRSKVDEHRVAYIQDGIYTTCNDPTHPHFGIRLYKTKVKENQIITGPANLFIEDIPLPLGVPFGFFPKTQKRASGIIFPSLREDASLGFSAENFGYYLGLNDHFDLSVLGEMYSLGSYGIRASSRYSWRYRFNGNFSFDYLRRKFPNDATGGYSLGKQFNIRWSHSQSNRGTGTNFSANVNAGSSKYYQNTTDFNLQDKARNTLASGINYSKTWLNTPFSLSASANHSQEVSTGQVSIGLPTLSFNVSRITPFDSKNRVGAQRWYHRIGMSYSLQADNRVTTGDSLLFSEQTLDRLQTGIRHSIPVSTSFNLLKYFFISPSFNYNERWYLKSFRKHYDPGVDRVLTDTVNGFQSSRDYSLSVGMNTRLFGMLNFKKGKIKAIRHVITPSIGFSYTPDFSAERYGYYRYYIEPESGRQLHDEDLRTRYSIFDGTLYGGPPSGLSKSMFFSIDNIIEMKVRSQNDTADGEEDGEKKIKLLDRLSINGGYNFADEMFPMSNITFSGSTTLFEKLSMSFNGSFDPYTIDSTGMRAPRLLIKDGGKLARLTRFSFSFRGSLNSRGEGNASGQPVNPTAGMDPAIQEQLYLIDPNPEAFVDFNLLWSFSFGYSFNYTNPGTYDPRRAAGPVSRITQALDMNGDFSL